MENPKEENPPEKQGGNILDPRTGLPFGQQQVPRSVVTVPSNQSSIIIPRIELLRLEAMPRHERKAWAADKKKKLGAVIDQYVKQAGLKQNGTPDIKTEEKE